MFKKEATMAALGLLLLFIWFVIIHIMALVITPTVAGLGEYTRIFYFHVPTAWVTVLAFLMAAVYSVLYLKKRREAFDIRAESANQIGIIFCILATITGSVWAKVSWGSFWNWDPRETSIFILLLIYAAYFALRSAIEPPERKAALSAAYSIIAFVTVPFFVFYVPRAFSSLHPDPIINKEIKIHMDPIMLITFLSSMTGFTLIFLWLFKQKVTLSLLKVKVDTME
jgi:heme exporter protein C